MKGTEAGAGDERLLHVAASRPQAEAWLLALGSQGLRARAAPLADGIGLFVDARDLANAEALLALYEGENQPLRLPPPSPPPPPQRTYVAVVESLLLLAFFFLADPGRSMHSWFNTGIGATDRILDGELWRTVTALTLHIDLPHALGNAVFLCLFGTALCRALGPGYGSLLILLSGAAGNALNAWLRGPGHYSVGASTAVFGAIGVLAMLQFQQRRLRQQRAWRVWLPLAAGLALLSMLGAGGRADVSAHIAGLVAGLALGWPAARLYVPGRARQWLLLAASAALVVLAWTAAFAAARAAAPF